MSEAIIEKKEEKLNLTDDPKVIDGSVGDTIKEGETFFVVEEVDEKSTKPDKKEGLTPEEIAAKAKEPDGGPSDKDEFEITNDMRVKLLETKITSLDAELADANLTPDAIRRRVPLADLLTDIERQKTILSDIDKEDNPDEWANQNRIVTTLRNDIADKEHTKKLDDRFNSQDNKDFLKNERKLLSDNGFKFSDVQFDGIAAAAKPYLENGKYTSEAIQKGLTDVIGADAVSKMYQTGAELKIREDLKAAAKKVTKSVRLTRDGISARLIPLNQRLMEIKDPFELEKALDALPPEQYANYKRALKNKK